MPAPLELTRPAGVAGARRGPLFRFDARRRYARRRRRSGDATRERCGDARSAVAQVGRPDRRADAAAADAAEILEFQAAMLADDELVAPALDAIAAGRRADAAWRDGARSAEIAGYEAADDDYFRARAADLAISATACLRNLAGAAPKPSPPGAILVGDDITPTRFLEADWSTGGGVALAGGSAASHVAMLARVARRADGGRRSAPIAIAGHARRILVDGESGSVVLRPGTAEHARFRGLRAPPARAERTARDHLRTGRRRTADGTAIARHDQRRRARGSRRIDPATCDGIGLMRTEFLFGGDALPDEEAQFRAYARVLDWAGGRPVTIRTLDAGGDKPVPG